VEFTLGDAEWSNGNADDSMKHFERALKHYTAAAAATAGLPGNARRRHDVALTQMRIASKQFWQSRIPEAIETQSRAISEARNLLRDDPNDRDVQQLLAAGLTELSTMKGRTGDFAAASETQAGALKLYESLYQADPADSKLETALAEAYLSTAQLCRTRGEGPAEADNMAKALQHARALAAADSTSPNLQHLLAQVLMNDADCETLRDDSASAAKSLDEAIAIYRKLLAANGSDRTATARLSVAYGALGGVFEKQNKFDDAITAISKAIETLSVQADADPHNAMIQAGIAYYQQLKGMTQTRGGKLDDAIATLRGALATFESTVASTPQDFLARRNSLTTRHALAEALLAAAEKSVNDSGLRKRQVDEAMALLIATREGYAPLIKMDQPDVQDVAAAKELEEQIRALQSPTTQP
jgi:tetratricopeptide (TPR) repeat protein